MRAGLEHAVTERTDHRTRWGNVSTRRTPPPCAGDDRLAAGHELGTTAAAGRRDGGHGAHPEHRDRRAWFNLDRALGANARRRAASVRRPMRRSRPARNCRRAHDSAPPERQERARDHRRRRDSACLGRMGSARSSRPRSDYARTRRQTPARRECRCPRGRAPRNRSRGDPAAGRRHRRDLCVSLEVAGCSSSSLHPYS